MSTLPHIRGSRAKFQRRRRDARGGLRVLGGAAQSLGRPTGDRQPPVPGWPFQTAAGATAGSGVAAATSSARRTATWRGASTSSRTRPFLGRNQPASPEGPCRRTRKNSGDPRGWMGRTGSWKPSSAKTSCTTWAAQVDCTACKSVRYSVAATGSTSSPAALQARRVGSRRGSSSGFGDTNLVLWRFCGVRNEADLVLVTENGLTSIPEIVISQKLLQPGIGSRHASENSSFQR